MADWRKIKTEYITGDVSLRALAEKSGVSFSQLGKRAAAEKWKEQREKQRNKTETKAKQKAVEKIADAESDGCRALLRQYRVKSKSGPRGP